MLHGVILVVRASGGIGRAIGSELLGAGADVILLGRSKARLQAAIPCTERSNAEYLEVDLTDSEAIENLGRTIARRGVLDALVLSSGMDERSNSP